MKVASDWRLFGALYGYPACCIEQFCTESQDEVLASNAPGGRRDDDAPWDGTGFIPCSDCAPAARADFPKFVAERIAPARQCKTTFPEGGR